MYENITAGIPVFKRVSKTKKCLKSIHDYGVENIIVTDDGIMTEERKNMYRELQNIMKNLRIIIMDYDSGLSAKRNKMVELCETKFFLMMDNDNTVKDINQAVKILNNKDDIAGVSGFMVENGVLTLDSVNLYSEGGYILKDVKCDIEYSEDYDYYIFDQIPNCGLFRTKVLQENPWDEFYKIGYEHEDFFWNMKKNTSWKFAMSPLVLFGHYPTNDLDNDYTNRKFSKRRQKFRNYFLNKWNFKGDITVSTGYVNPSCKGRDFFMSRCREFLPASVLNKVQKLV